jgi:hypothetical protein
MILFVLGAFLALSLAAIAASEASAAKHFQRQCDKLDKPAHEKKCDKRNPDGVRGD